MQHIKIHPFSLVLGALAMAAALLATGMQQVDRATRFPGLTPEQKDILGHLSIVWLDDGQGGQAKTIRVEGVNLQVVNGLGATNGYPTNPDVIDPGLTQTNGVGNLIVGYNELGNYYGDDRTGSHNIVAGMRSSHSSFGGLVVGSVNTLSGPYATISGGGMSFASGHCAAVGGGKNNTAGHPYAAVVGGGNNTAGGEGASVSGGRYNIASGLYASVSGGGSWDHDRKNLASGDYASVSGGQANRAEVEGASVSGGFANTASGSNASVGGGWGNVASGGTSAVSGGTGRSATGSYDWAAGSLWEDL